MKNPDGNTGLMPGWSGLIHRLDCWRFGRERAEYCAYLCALLEGMRGSRTLRDIFAQDAARHGAGTVRGRLSARWLRDYQLSGGDLHTTWHAAFPQDELALLRSAQAGGNQALIAALGRLASTGQVAGQMRAIFATALWSAVAAKTLAYLMLLAIPWWTLPRLLQAFSVLSPAYYGPYTVRLVALAEAIQAYWLVSLILFGGAWFFAIWSLPNLTGAWRRRLDRVAGWRLYRHMQGLRLLGLLAILLGGGQIQTTRLRSALRSLGEGAAPWLAGQIDAMLAHIEAGYSNAAIFDTGLLDPPQFWFLSDLIEAQGLHAGLSAAAARLQQDALSAARRQASSWRWVLLLGSVGCILGLGFWHYAVIDELRRALMLLYAG